VCKKGAAEGECAPGSEVTTVGGAASETLDAYYTKFTIGTTGSTDTSNWLWAAFKASMDLEGSEALFNAKLNVVMAKLGPAVDQVKPAFEMQLVTGLKFAISIGTPSSVSDSAFCSIPYGFRMTLFGAYERSWQYRCEYPPPPPAALLRIWV
jgi:hypothetical protein